MDEQDLTSHIDKLAISADEYTVACLLKEMYGSKFRYSGKRWYEDDIEVPEGIPLRQKIVDLLPMMKNHAQTYLMYETDNIFDKERYNRKADNLINLSQKLRTTQFQNSVMTQCKMLFYTRAE